MPTLKKGWDLLAFENQPVVHYLVLRGWCALGFGATDVGLRVLGLVISILLLSALWLSCWLFNKSPPLWPLAMFALNPYTLRADSLRPHGLALVWIVLAFAFIWQLTFQPQRTRTIVLAAIAAVLSVQTVFLNAFLLGAICAGSIVVLAWRRAWRAAAWILGIGFIAALSLTPYVPMIIKAHDWNGIRALPHSIGYLTNGFYAVSTAHCPIVYGVFLALLAGAFALIVVSWLRKRLTEPADSVGEHFLFAAVASAAAAIATGGFLSWIKFPVQNRYYLPLIAVIALSGAVVTAAFRKCTMLRWGMLLASVLLGAAFFRPAYNYTATRLTNCDLAAAAVAAHAEPDDIIVLTRFAYGITFQRYYRGGVPWHGTPDISDYSLFRWDLVKQAMMQTDPIHELLVRIEFALRSGHSVFLVGRVGGVPGVQPEPLAPAPLTTHGWDMESYIANWSGRVTYLLEEHGVRERSIPLPEQERGDPIETLTVHVISGWR